MPIYEIEAPDGRILEIEGDQFPSEAELNDIFASTQQVQGKGTKAEPFQVGVSKNIDLRPSGLARTAAKYAVGVPTSAVESLVTRKPFGEVFNKNQELFKQVDELPAVKRGDTALDIGTAFMLPEVKAVQGIKGANAINRALTGAYQGGLIGGAESLANEGDLSGVVPGAVGGTVLNTGLPVVGNLAEKTTKLLPMAGGFMGRALGRIQPETLKQAVKPNSIALDLDRANAENLLMNTTERVQQTYKDLLTKRGKTVREAIKALPTDKGISRKELKQILNDIYDSYSDSGNPNLNVAKNESADLYKYANNLIDKSKRKIVNAQEVKEILKNIQKHAPKNVFGRIASDTDDQIYKQLYGNYNSKLSELSPELAQANKGYAELKNFAENEGVSGILYPKELNPAKKLDSASRTLRNYNSTVTSGNKNRNIQDLENLFVKEGYEPFLNQVDDVNAAMDLLNARTTGDSWLANIATQATRPALKLARYANRKGLPQAYERLKRALPQNFVPYVYGIKELIDRD